METILCAAVGTARHQLGLEAYTVYGECVMCAAVGTARRQQGLEAYTVFGDCNVCSCRHSKTLPWTEKWQSCTKPTCTKLASKHFLMFSFVSSIHILLIFHSHADSLSLSEWMIYYTSIVMDSVYTLRHTWYAVHSTVGGGSTGLVMHKVILYIFNTSADCYDQIWHLLNSKLLC